MAFMQITISPRGGKGTSVGDYVAKICRYLKSQNLPYELNDMATIVEGRATELYALARKLHEVPFKMGMKPVYTTIAIDDRRDKTVHMGDKVKSVQKRLRKG